jgi:hypothetical protein
MLIFLFSTLILLSEVGTKCYHHIVIKIRHIDLRPAACLTSTLLETGVDANDCNCSRANSLTCLPKHEIILFGHPSNDRPLRTMLSFCDCTLSALTAQPPSHHGCRRRRLKDYQHSLLRCTAIRRRWAYYLSHLQYL